METEELKEGYIYDYISNIQIKATPEEVDAVQVFAKQLVQDYNYPKENIQTHPQFRVKMRPSDTRKEYPIDIAVFNSSSRDDDDLHIIVECKKKNRKDGLSQLQTYMRLSQANIGVWFNGNERLYIHKIEKDGQAFFEEIPNIPLYNQRLEDIGKFKRRDLKVTHNLKSTFKAIRNHLAANAVGVGRDETLAQQLINIIFCKIYDEKYTMPNDMVRFRAGVDESPSKVKKRIDDLFEDVKENFTDVLEQHDKIELDEKSITYVVGELQNYCLMEAERDVIADAFETFIGHALKGESGQFFTPRNVVKMMVQILSPNEKELVIDPACGSGGFLIDSLRHAWGEIDKLGERFAWSNEEVSRMKQKVASDNFYGIDKDGFLAKVTKAYMTLIGDGKSGIVCDDSLENPENWTDNTKQRIKIGGYDIVLTNPPFGAKIPVKGEQKLKQYQLGHKWKKDIETGMWEMGKLREKEAPQILFIERCLQFLKDGGRMAIVLPDGILGNDQLGYIRQYLLDNCRLVAVIDVPIETFMPNTGTKTSILVLKKEKVKDTNYPIFMAIAETCGHDRRGNTTLSDDVALVADEFHKWCKENDFRW